MKKLFLILVCLPIIALADDCANAYKAGLDLYKQGQYVEAQAKFIAVAKICGDYADVWNKLKSCNQKLSEKQSQQALQIASLKAEIKQSEQTDKPNDAASSTVLGKEAMSIIKNIDSIKADAKQSKEQLKVANDSIAVLKGMLKDANADLEKLRKDVESLNQQIEELKKPAPAEEKDKKEIKSGKNAKQGKIKPQKAPKESTKKESTKKGTGKKDKE